MQAFALLALSSVAGVVELDGAFDATAPLDVGSAAPPSVSACASCHVNEAREWVRSRHRVSATNTLFLDGFAVEPHARCAYCHAPLAEQARDMLRARRAVVARAADAIPPTSSAHEGISCATCHVRDGKVVGTRVVRAYAHTVEPSDEWRELRPREALRDPAFCATCHEFDAHEVVDGRTIVLRGQVLQSTYSEWQRYAKSGGQGTCQTCHMPPSEDGTPSHEFLRGGHDVAALKAALVVDIERDQASGARYAALSSRGVGHSYPSGDLFRHLTLSVDDVELARFGKRFEIVTGGDGLPHKRLAEDTSLEPGEVRRVALPANGRRLKVTYHYADDAAEARGEVSYDELVVTLVDRAISR